MGRDALCAFVELKPEQNASKDDLIAWCRQHLARYKVPRYVVFAELPKTSTGKIQKFKLREKGKGIWGAGIFLIKLPPQRAQPSGKRLTKEPNLLLAALRLAIERCPPLHECSVAVNDGHES